MSVAITIEDDIDISRGNMIVKKNNQPNTTQKIDSLIMDGRKTFKKKTKNL